jgi:hypothetical protein
MALEPGRVDVVRRAARLGEPPGCWRDRTLRWSGEARSRRTPTHPWSARPPERRRAELQWGPLAVAHPTREAAAARAAGPTAAGRRKAMDRLAGAPRSLAVVRPLRRTDSIPRVSPLGSVADQPVRMQVEVAVVPKQVRVQARVQAGRAGPTAAAAAAVAAAARSAAEAEARPTGVGAPERPGVAALEEPGARSAELVAGSGRVQVPPHRASPRGARRKRDRTCWWAGW